MAPGGDTCCNAASTPTSGEFGDFVDSDQRRVRPASCEPCDSDGGDYRT